MTSAKRDRSAHKAAKWSAMVEAVKPNYGYVEVGTLHRMDFTRHQLAHLVATGRLTSVGRGIYRLPGSESSWKSKLFYFTIRGEACASHLSAAMLWGLGRPADLSPGVAEITTPVARRVSLGDAVRVFRTSGWDLTSRTAIHQIPVTGIGRTLLDIASVHGERRFRECFNTAVRKKLITLEELESDAVGDRVWRRRGVRQIESTLQSVGEAVVPQSEWSNWAVETLVLAGLPTPELEVVLCDGNGHFIGQVDLYWRAFGVVVELDGIDHHFQRSSFASDRLRDARLAAEGIVVIRVTWAQFQQKGYLVRIVQQALAQRGFQR